MGVGLLGGLLRKPNPGIKERPWRVLSDGKKFLHSKAARSAYELRRVSLWKIPPRSPDLNPIEKFWSWLRKELRRRDLEDYKAKRPCLTKAQYIARVREVLLIASCWQHSRWIEEGVPGSGGQERRSGTIMMWRREPTALVLYVILCRTAAEHNCQ